MQDNRLLVQLTVNELKELIISASIEKNIKQDSDVVDINGAASILLYSPTTIYCTYKAKKIPYFWDNGLKFKKTELLEWKEKYNSDKKIKRTNSSSIIELEERFLRKPKNHR